jgi:hypothetical protein
MAKRILFPADGLMHIFGNGPERLPAIIASSPNLPQEIFLRRPAARAGSPGTLWGQPKCR